MHPRTLGFCLLTMACACDQASAPTTLESAPTRNTSADAPDARFDWQATSVDALGDTGLPGAVVVLDARTSELVALHEVAGASFLHPAASAVHPASSLKPLLYLGALETGRIEPGHRVDCAGSMEMDGETLTCFGQHGDQGIDAAIASSCNVFAYDVAQRLGMDEVSRAYRGFDFGSPTGLVADEDSGLVPDRQHYEDAGGFHEAHTAATAIGHAQMRATPLQVARAYAEHIARRRSDHRDQVLAGMVRAVEEESGSGHAAHVEGLTIAGKTGTSEVEGGEGYDAWFVAIAPAEDPEVVVTVLVRGGEVAPKSAAPLAGRILEAWRASPAFGSSR